MLVRLHELQAGDRCQQRRHVLLDRVVLVELRVDLDDDPHRERLQVGPEPGPGAGPAAAQVVDQELAVQVAGAEVVEVDLAGGAPGDHFLRLERAEVGQSVGGDRLGGQADPKLLDPAAVGAAADRRVVEPEQIEDRHDAQRDVGRPHDVAAHVEDVVCAGVGGWAAGVPGRLG